nr:nucleotidyltransferase domain-containing protein [Paenibacillus sp. J31TS4]
MDIVILDHALRPYRASFFLNGWPIESFLHTEASCQEQFQIERSKGRPVLASMVAEGNLLKDNGKGIGLKELAVQFLARGPASLTADQIRDSRYFQFDLLDDFRDARSEEEAMITLNAMSVRLMDFLLRYNNQWSGSGKTLVRAFRSFDSGLSDRWFQALTSYYQEGDRRQVIRFVEEVYQPLGGRLFAGYSSWLDTGEPK